MSVLLSRICSSGQLRHLLLLFFSGKMTFRVPLRPLCIFPGMFLLVRCIPWLHMHLPRCVYLLKMHSQASLRLSCIFPGIFLLVRCILRLRLHLLRDFPSGKMHSQAPLASSQRFSFWQDAFPGSTCIFPAAFISSRCILKHL